MISCCQHAPVPSAPARSSYHDINHPPMHLECFGLDCMLRQRKNHLVRQLWRARVSRGDIGGDGGKAPSQPATDSTDMQMRSALNSILKRLDVDELELLLEAVKSKGRAHNQCIHVVQSASSPPANTKDLGLETSHTVCRAWRWTDLPCSTKLQALPNCQIPHEGSIGDSVVRMCVNPYHWCRVVDVNCTGEWYQPLW